MDFTHYKAAKPIKKGDKEAEVISIFHRNYKVVERAKDDEDKKLPIIVKPYGEEKGFKFFEPQRGFLTEGVFNTVQRIRDCVFFCENNGQKIVYIINEHGQTGMSEFNYDFIVGEMGTVKKLLATTTYKKHDDSSSAPQRQPGSEE